MKKQNTFVTGALLIVLLALAGFVLLVRPARGSIDDAQADLDQANSELIDLRTRINALTPDPDDTEMQELLTKVPRTLDESGVIDQIGKLAAASGIAVTDIGLSVPTGAESGGGSQTAIDLSVAGQRAEIDGFLTGLATLPRLTVLDEVIVRPHVSNDPAVAEAPDADPADPAATTPAPTVPQPALVAVEVSLTIRSGLDVTSGA